MSNKSYVTYTDFGAVGDGVTDDFEAILRAHEYANENKLPVVTDDGKTYYIHETRIDGEVRTVIIKTDVTWGSSKFTIDDRDMGYFDGTDRTKRPIFRIESYYEPITVDDPEVLARIGSIGEGATKINYAPGYTALLVIFNDDHRVYHRSGASYVARGGQSSPQHEVLLVDKDLQDTVAALVQGIGLYPPSKDDRTAPLRPQESFMRRHTQRIYLHFSYRYWHMPRALGAVDDKNNTVSSAKFAYFAQRHSKRAYITCPTANEHSRIFSHHTGYSCAYNSGRSIL